MMWDVGCGMWAVADHRCRLGGRLGCLDRLVGPHNGAEGLAARHMCFTALWPHGVWPLALQRRLDHAARRFGRSASVVASAVAGAVAGVVAAVVAVPAVPAAAAVAGGEGGEGTGRRTWVLTRVWTCHPVARAESLMHLVLAAFWSSGCLWFVKNEMLQ